MESIIQDALVAIGVIDILFFIFHLFFPRLFQWEKNKINLDKFNWAIYQTYHLIVLLMLAAMAYISIRHAADLVSLSLGGILLLFFVLFFVIRIAAEFLCFGFDKMRSLIIIGACLVPAVIYLLGFLESLRRVSG